MSQQLPANDAVGWRYDRVCEQTLTADCPLVRLAAIRALAGSTGENEVAAEDGWCYSGKRGRAPPKAHGQVNRHSRPCTCAGPV